MVGIEIKKINLEAVFLLAVFSVLVWAGCAILFDYKINHDFPFAYLASDTFQHQVRTESVKVMGNYKYEAPYIVAGYKDNVGFYPPLIYHTGVVFSYLSGLETYDGAYLLLFILAGFASLIMYIIIRQFNKSIAIISIPLSVLIFSGAPYTGFTWGHWPSITAQFFLIAFFWSLSKIDLKNSFILFAVFLSGIVMAHTSEAVFAALFLIVFFAYKFLKKDYKTLAVQSIFGSIISFALCFYFLVIFKFTWAKWQPYTFNIIPEWGSPAFELIHFKIMLIFLFAGLIISLFYMFTKPSAAFFIGIFMLIIGYGNYYGFGSRAFQARFFWPIYLSVFFGLGVYHLLKLVIKKWNVSYSLIIGIIVLIFLNTAIAGSLLPTTSRFTSQGIMTKQHWDMFKWFQDNVEDGKILFFYGDLYGQKAILRNTLIPSYLVNTNDFVEALQNRTIRRSYKISLEGDHHGVAYAYRKSFFEYGYHAKEEEAKDASYYYNKMRDICAFDYLVFDRASQQPVFAQYNMLIANELLKKDWIKLDYYNEYVVVLKNSKPGEDCINETRIS